MSLQTRLSALITAIGADVKALQARTPTILGEVSSLSNTSQPTKAVEWWNTGDGTLIAKLAALTKVENATILNRTELWARVRSRTNDVTVDRMILDSNGLSMLVPQVVTSLPTTGPGTNSALADGQECYFLADATNGVVWHLKYRAAEAGAHKWYYVGGPPMYNEVAAADTTTSAAYVDLANAGPQLTAPLAGDYDITPGMSGQHSAAGGFAVAQTKLGSAAQEASDVASIYSHSASAAEQNYASRTVRRNVAAGALLKMQYYASPGGGANTITAKRRTLSITPVRVG